MDEKTPAELEAENQALEVDPTLETKQPESQEVAKSEYQIKLDELEAEKARQEEIIANKNRAIEALKEKAKKPTVDEDALLEKLAERLEQKRNDSDMSRRINALTSDEAERKLIEHHLKNSIKPTGDLDKDLKLAIGAMDSDKLWAQRQGRALEERREDFISAFAGTSLRGESAAMGKSYDPVQAAARELVRSINPAAEKNVDYYSKNL